MPAHPTCSSCFGTGLQRLPWVQLAAYLQDEAAREVTNPPFPAPAQLSGRPEIVTWRSHYDAAPLGAWARGLSRWGREATVRAVLASTRAALARNAHAPSGYHATNAIEGLEAWLACPCAQHHRALCADAHPGEALLVPPWAPCGCTMDRIEPILAADTLCVSPYSGAGMVREAIRASLLPWALSHL
jgi:hypothetical protein